MMLLNRVSVLALIALAGFAASADATLISNGSFEAGLAPWSLTNADAGADYEHVNNFANFGTHSIRFGEALFPTELSQAVPFVDGVEYQVSLWVHNLGAGDDFLEVGTPSGILYSGGVGTELESWVELTYTFTATAADTSLTIRARDQISTVYIDDVSITEVPEPATLSLLGLGGLALLRRRR